jgi:hypothetical protein
MSQRTDLGQHRLELLGPGGTYLVAVALLDP